MWWIGITIVFKSLIKMGLTLENGEVTGLGREKLEPHDLSL